MSSNGNEINLKQKSNKNKRETFKRQVADGVKANRKNEAHSTVAREPVSERKREEEDNRHSTVVLEGNTHCPFVEYVPTSCAHRVTSSVNGSPSFHL